MNQNENLEIGALGRQESTLDLLRPIVIPLVYKPPTEPHNNML